MHKHVSDTIAKAIFGTSLVAEKKLDDNAVLEFHSKPAKIVCYDAKGGPVELTEPLIAYFKHRLDSYHKNNLMPSSPDTPQEFEKAATEFTAYLCKVAQDPQKFNDGFEGIDTIPTAIHIKDLPNVFFPVRNRMLTKQPLSMTDPRVLSLITGVTVGTAAALHGCHRHHAPQHINASPDTNHVQRVTGENAPPADFYQATNTDWTNKVVKPATPNTGKAK